jgi:hypothetical protein
MRWTPAYYKWKRDAVQQGTEYLASIGPIQAGSNEILVLYYLSSKVPLWKKDA